MAITEFGRLHPDILIELSQEARHLADRHDYTQAITTVSKALATVNDITLKRTLAIHQELNNSWLFGNKHISQTKIRAMIAAGSIKESPDNPKYQGFAYIAVKIAHDTPELSELVDDLMTNATTETVNYLKLIAIEPNPDIRLKEMINHLEPLKLANIHISNAPGISEQQRSKAAALANKIELVVDYPKSILVPGILAFE